MKIIHCADLHLDSPLESVLDHEHARLRRAELLNSFVSMVEYAHEDGVAAVLIAGDLFDRSKVSAEAENIVLSTIEKYPSIRFFYLRGNHDCGSPLAFSEKTPANLHGFGTDWTFYDLGRTVQIIGAEPRPSDEPLFDTLQLDDEAFHIVLLHGQALWTAEDAEDVVPLNKLVGRGIDYLALGHYHAFRTEKIDARGTCCYSGCLDPRGFDEPGEHGFVLLDIDEQTRRFEIELIPNATRLVRSVTVDVTDQLTSAQLADCIEKALLHSDVTTSNYVALELTGELDLACEKDLQYLQTRFESRFFALRISDHTQLKIDLEAYRNDISLKGELVREVLQDASLTPQEQKTVIRYALQALAGEEVG